MSDCHNEFSKFIDEAMKKRKKNLKFKEEKKFF